MRLPKLPSIRIKSPYFIISSAALLIFVSVLIFSPKETWKGLFGGKIYNLATAFTTAVNYPVGTTPWSVFAADFNNDNKLDLATANFDSNNVSILIGDGAGGFVAATNFNVDTNPQSVFAAYFNNDGNMDLAVANNGSGTVSVLFGDGTGIFPASTTLSVGYYPSSIFVIDFNHDDNLDIAVANVGTTTISIFFGDGTGTFPASTTLSAGIFSDSIFATDLNHDSNIDLAIVANKLNNNTVVFFGDGTGAFPASTTLTMGSFPVSIFATDLNNDGHIDLAATNYNTSGTVTIFFGDGTGAFPASSTLSVGNFPQSIYASNFNYDGNQDLAVISNINSGTVSVFLGDGTGAFPASTTLSTGSYPLSVFSADLNNDGTQDLAVTNDGGDNNVSVLLGINPLPTTTSISPTSAIVGDATSTMTATGTNFISSSVIQFNGSSAGRTTTFVSSTTLTTDLLTSDLVASSTFFITVFNSTPGGGTSTTSLPFIVNDISYTLTYLAGANGSIIGSSTQIVAYSSSGTAVTAVPTASYHFVNWSDTSVANPRTDTNIGSNITVTANFAINASGSGGGGGGFTYPTVLIPDSPSTPPQPEGVGGNTENIILVSLPLGFCFTKNLYPYVWDTDVRYLQIFLNNQGFNSLPIGSENNYYGLETTNAVISFQEKYPTDILIDPYGLYSGTGNFANYTRKKVNDILGCGTVFEATHFVIPAPPQPTPIPTPVPTPTPTPVTPPQNIPVIPGSTTTTSVPTASTTPEPAPVTPTEPTPTNNIPSNIIESFTQTYNQTLAFLSDSLQTVTNFITGKNAIWSIIAIVLGVILLILLILYAFKSFGNKKPGIIKDKSTNLPLAFATVKIFKEGMSNMPVITRVTDKDGRYSALVPKGNYHLEIEKKNLDGTYTQVYKSGVVNIKKGIINEDLVV